MPDDKDTDPEIAIPEEPPTRPDIRLVTCPKCRGQGTVLEPKESGTAYSGTLKRCTFCGGRKRVDRAVLVRLNATRQGRPSK